MKVDCFLFFWGGGGGRNNCHTCTGDIFNNLVSELLCLDIT